MGTNQCLLNYKMLNKEIKVPNIGEFKDVEVIEVLVSIGQLVSKNDPLITIESDKSSVEIPSTYEGEVKKLNIKVGDKVSEGSTILTLEVKEKNKEETKIQNEEIKPKIGKEKKIIKEKVERINTSEKTAASPNVRKFARELGVNIDQIPGSERKGRVIENDVKNFISSRINKTEQSQERK